MPKMCTPFGWGDAVKNSRYCQKKKKKRLLQLNVPRSRETGIILLFNAHQLLCVVSFHSLPISWANLFIIFACPFFSPLQEVCVSHFVVPLCCCSFSSHARIIVPLLHFHRLQSAVLSSQNPALAIGKKDV